MKAWGPWQTGIALIGACAALAVLPAASARADWELLPESRHHLYESYAFFIEHHNTLVYRGQNRYWAAAAANLPIAGNPDSAWKPQVLFHFSGNDSMHVDSQGGVYTETLDTRIGFLLDLALASDPSWRFFAGFFHESGHTADGTDDPELNALNLGLNVLWFRAMHDIGHAWRFGINVFPVVHSIPENVVFGLSEFIELWPWGSGEDGRHPAPYVGVSLGHKASFNTNVTLDAQIGLALGAHFDEKHSHSARLVLGYYNGPDPRAKYAEFLLTRTTFGYFGLMFDL